MMKKALFATAVALLPSFAQAQECTQLEALQSAWQEQNINTDLVFRGQGDNGTLTYIFQNPDNGRWSEWMASPINPSCVRLFDQGGGANTDRIGFTNATEQPAPESNL